jgi:hypothetical protein
MNRRKFLSTLIGGVVASAAVRTLPFRVYSFPSELAQPPQINGQVFVRLNELTRWYQEETAMERAIARELYKAHNKFAFHILAEMSKDLWVAPFPKGAKELAQAGYIYRGDSICKHPECKALIHWFQHSETKQKMPIDSITREPHWKTCIGADGFRKKKKAPAEPVELQRNMFEREPGED